MLDCLTIDAGEQPGAADSPKKQNLYWINGLDVLQLAQYAMDSIDTSGKGPTGDGTYARPWGLSGDPLDWIALARDLRRWTGVDRYFWICGRFVKKVGGYYMVDAGGDNGVDSRGNGRAWDQNIIWDRYTRSWKGVDFDRGGPSYRNYANYMENIRIRQRASPKKSGRSIRPRSCEGC